MRNKKHFAKDTKPYKMVAIPYNTDVYKNFYSIYHGSYVYVYALTHQLCQRNKLHYVTHLKCLYSYILG